MRRIFGFSILFCLSWLSAWSQVPVLGQWKTLDDSTGEPRSIVEIYFQEGKVYGKIKSIYREAGEEPNPLCTECTGDKKDQPIIGMVVLEGLKADGEEWAGGKILDPENGKTYNCRIWLSDPNTLKVRGYWSFFYRTQTWIRVK